MTHSWHSGNAIEDGAPFRSWIVGHFVDQATDIRFSKDVEVKWGIHLAGEQRPDWATNEQRTALVILVSGGFRIELASAELSQQSVFLKEQGDYVIWGPGTDHSWYAEQDSVVITIRWPSLS